MDVSKLGALKKWWLFCCRIKHIQQFPKELPQNIGSISMYQYPSYSILCYLHLIFSDNYLHHLSSKVHRATFFTTDRPPTVLVSRISPPWRYPQCWCSAWRAENATWDFTRLNLMQTRKKRVVHSAFSKMWVKNDRTWGFMTNIGGISRFFGERDKGWNISTYEINWNYKTKSSNSFSDI